MQNSLPQGFIPVMLTPFKENGEIDFEGLTKLTEFYLEAGAAGLFANCLSSEMYELSEDERIAITKHVVDVANGRVPVVATGTFGGPIAEQAEFAKKIYGTGIQAVIVITSLIATADESDAIFMERMHELLQLTPGVSYGLYECPVPYKRLVSAESLGELAATGRVIYHKDTSLDIENVKAKIAATQGQVFGVYDAYMEHAVASLKAGSAGLSCIQGNFFPELIVWLCNNFNEPTQQDKVQRVQQLLIDTMPVIHYAYPTVAKYYLQKRGFPISLYTRRKVEVLTEVEKANADELLEMVNALSQEIEVDSLTFA
ncbi:dihydrodipicolinate synthase family protein [Runella salmonicolor]|uniref:Dihydrodipicolinate synthase family protein n=1 Tax=Runella salmonicolor TaxID=2950278 RepID=A0ABT1FI94_9BACT|nr:dihydrodipicolinate synthase family protein [Runella salmonicolor]MCP1381444.1 dihydrodipicolinate synthase family protein [Runella salmonicolor]